MKKRLATIFLAGLMLVFSACSCNSGGSGGTTVSDKIPSASDTTGDVSDHFVTSNVLHNVSVDYNNNVGVFVTNTTTQYEIVTTEEYKTAAQFIAKHVLEATGAIVRVTTSDKVEDVSSKKYIIFGIDSALEPAGLTKPARSELGVAGYYIKTVGDDIYISCYSTSGAQLAAISFLQHVIGYDMLSDDLVIYEKDGSVMPQMDIKERPDYDYRKNSNSMTANAIYGMGFTTTSTMMSIKNNKEVHNFYHFLNMDDVTNHPKWFSDGAYINDNSDPDKQGDDYNLGQPCFTAHGDKEEYQEMIKRVADTFTTQLKSNTNVASVRISLNDVLNLDGMNAVKRCTCDACNASYEYYGTVAGSILSFANDVSKVVQEWIAENQEGRDFNIVVLAYGEALSAPVKRDENKNYVMENGKGVPITRRDFDESGNGTDVTDENGNAVFLTCADGVGWEYAASGANWIHSYYDSENEKFASQPKAWAGVGGKMYVWAYEINYYKYLYPYNNYDIMIENYRYFKSLNATYMYSEGTWENKNNSGFAKLRDYINSKALFNVNVNYADLKAKFFKYYFGEAEEYMLEFFDKVVLTLKNNESTTGGSVHSNKLASTKIWTQTIIENYLDLIDKSYAAIETVKKTNAELYDAYYNHILIESLFPRYVLLTEYDSTLTATERQTMRQKYADDFDTLGNTTDQEHYTIRGEGRLFATWGV